MNYLNKLSLFLGIILILSCNQTHRIDESKQDYFHTIIDKVQRVVLTKDWDKATAYYDSLFSLPEYKTSTGLYFKYVVMRELYKTGTLQNDFKIALHYADSAINVYSKFDNQSVDELFNNYMVKGILLIKLQRYAEGLHYLFEGKLIAQKGLDRCYTAQFDEDVAYLFFSQQRFADAKDYYIQAFENRVNCYSDNTVEFYHRVRSLNNIGFSFEKMGQQDSAISWYEKALDFVYKQSIDTSISRENVLEWEGVVKGNLGYLYFQTGKADSAETFLRRSIFINKTPNHDYNDALLTEIKLAELLINKKKLPQAFSIIESLKKEPYITNQLQYSIRLKRIIWLYFEELGNIPKAYQAFMDWQIAQNNYNNDQVSWRNINITSELDERENLKAINELQTENQFKTTLLGLIGIIALLLGIIVYLFNKNSSNLKSNVKKLEQTNDLLNKSYADLEKTLEENARIMGIIAHDLRAPLAGIIGYAQLYGEDKNHENRDLYIKTITDISNNAMDLIDELLGFHESVHNNELTLESLDDIIDYCISLNRFKVTEKNQNIVFNHSGLGVWVQKERFWRVINNLIHNAIKFSRINASIYITIENTSEFISISVRDTGIGIPKQIISELFTATKAIRRIGTAGENSHGMGLAICKKIMQSHKGDISVQSVEGEGSTFTITLPHPKHTS